MVGDPLAHAARDDHARPRPAFRAARSRTRRRRSARRCRSRARRRRMRAAASTSARLPLRWPQRSLIPLKPSRSTNSSDSGRLRAQRPLRLALQRTGEEPGVVEPGQVVDRRQLLGARQAHGVVQRGRQRIEQQPERLRIANCAPSPRLRRGLAAALRGGEACATLVSVALGGGASSSFADPSIPTSAPTTRPSQRSGSASAPKRVRSRVGPRRETSATHSGWPLSTTRLASAVIALRQLLVMPRSHNHARPRPSDCPSVAQPSPPNQSNARSTRRSPTPSGEPVKASARSTASAAASRRDEARRRRIGLAQPYGAARPSPGAPARPFHAMRLERGLHVATESDASRERHEFVPVLLLSSCGQHRQAGTPALRGRPLTPSGLWKYTMAYG